MICIYCGQESIGQNITKEHVIPQWIIKKLDLKFYKLSLLPISRELKVFDARTPVINTLTHKICSKCNNGWLSEIDNSCIELLDYMIDGKDIYEIMDSENLKKLFNLIYKIFLNYLAIGPNSFKEKNISEYQEYFKYKFPPSDVNLFFCKILASDGKFCISSLGLWPLVHENQFDYKNDGFGFKFYIQLGEVAFVLCKVSDTLVSIDYDDYLLSPIIIQNSTRNNLFHIMEVCPKPFVDTPANSILLNALRLRLY
ncbi:conserved hypothetical protein [Acinetobacter proteolyticus]|uniref:HNH endonuclease 5 domain-containing protein n=1 Tax=Acinetobacter proteolyticus TaxID=1776741 RepID=A0A653K644_9GAMM|nr:MULTISPECIES: hypothetical protein [Acinetobacter]MCH7338192.1 hypothetical protein [Acinetobacter higginsii]VXA55420.1 conserved hypothetical protein [Acinetobacter proteolyticus]